MKKLLAHLGGDEGLYFIETLFAVFVLSVGIISISGLFMLGIKQSAVAEDLTHASVLAQDKMEELMNSSYDSLVAGGDAGSITTSVTGYYDEPQANYTRRWQIDVDAPMAGTSIIRVGVFSSRELVGVPKECVLRLVRTK